MTPDPTSKVKLNSNMKERSSEIKGIDPNKT